MQLKIQEVSPILTRKTKRKRRKPNTRKKHFLQTFLAQKKTLPANFPGIETLPWAEPIFEKPLILPAFVIVRNQGAGSRPKAGFARPFPAETVGFHHRVVKRFRIVCVSMCFLDQGCERSQRLAEMRPKRSQGYL